MLPFSADRRTHERLRFRGRVELVWTNEKGDLCNTVGNCVNKSLFGLQIEAPSDVPVGVEVEVRADLVGFPKSASVRNCRPYAGWFRIGLRFSEPVLPRDIQPEVLGGLRIVRR